MIVWGLNELPVKPLSCEYIMLATDHVTCACENAICHNFKLRTLARGHEQIYAVGFYGSSLTCIGGMPNGRNTGVKCVGHKMPHINVIMGHRDHAGANCPDAIAHTAFRRVFTVTHLPTLPPHTNARTHIRRVCIHICAYLSTYCCT